MSSGIEGAGLSRDERAALREHRPLNAIDDATPRAWSPSEPQPTYRLELAARLLCAMMTGSPERSDRGSMYLATRALRLADALLDAAATRESPAGPTEG